MKMEDDIMQIIIIIMKTKQTETKKKRNCNFTFKSTPPTCLLKQKCR